MDLKVEWTRILMILGAGTGGVLTVILYAITANDLSLSLFPLGLLGGWFLGFLVEKLVYRKR